LLAWVAIAARQWQNGTIKKRGLRRFTRSAIIMLTRLPRLILIATPFSFRLTRYSWRRLDGHNQLPKLILGVKFSDGLDVVVRKVAPHPATAAA
jgi:hypothetical protein